MDDRDLDEECIVSRSYPDKASVTEKPYSNGFSLCLFIC